MQHSEWIQLLIIDACCTELGEFDFCQCCCEIVPSLSYQVRFLTEIKMASNMTFKFWYKQYLRNQWNSVITLPTIHYSDSQIC
jgi:hypothetical protein